MPWQVVLDAMSMHSDSSAMQWAGCWTMPLGSILIPTEKMQDTFANETLADLQLRFCLCIHNAEMRCEVAAYGAARVALKARRGVWAAPDMTTFRRSYGPL